MTIVDKSRTATHQAAGISSLVPRCAHRNSDGSTAWVKELRRGRWGSYEAFTCSLCGAGAEDGETLRAAVGECVRDR